MAASAAAFPASGATNFAIAPSTMKCPSGDSSASSAAAVSSISERAASSRAAWGTISLCV